jgi:hypothetical protein
MNNNNLFGKRLAQLGIKKQVDAVMITNEAQKTINEKFGVERGNNNLRPVSYAKGILKIAASTNAWAAECQGIVGKLKKPPVERVVFIVGIPENLR